MAKLVTKFKYLKPSAGENVGGYAKYIATREGVDKIDDTAKLSPATIKQKQLIEKILKDFPDAKEMLEYEDYLANQTIGRASEFISRALEDNADEVMSTKTYADYIATRPRAERFGTHGLFTDDGVQVKLNKVSEELNLHGGNVWTVIISLRREDAERLGYNTGVRWRDMLRTQTESLATNLKIPMENLKWFAAFHNESYHPHVHLIAYSTVENEGYLTKQGVKNLRKTFAKDIFAQDLLCIYEKQTQHRDELRMQSNEIIADIVSRINSESYDNPKVEKMLLALADKLSRTKGKKVYGYLKADVKSMVDAIVDELARDERIAKLYGLWYEQKEEILHIYSETGQRKVPLSQNNEFKTIRNAVISEAMNLVTGKANGEIEGLNEQEIEPQEVTEMMTPDIDITDEDAPMDADEPTDTDEPMKADELMEEQTEGNTESHTATKKGFGYSYKRKKTWWTDEYKLARKYLYGAKDSKPDVEKAFGLMMEEAHKGNGFAIHDVGKMLLSGLGCEKDEVQAQEWFQKAYEAFIKEESKSDNPGYLQYRIGKLYSFGYGVVQDYPKAAEWYEKAVAENNPFAAYALGSLYHRGQGVMQDEKEAYRLFVIAATNQLKPNAYAQYELGKMCRDGIGTGVDMEASEEWFKRAYQGFEKIESTMADDRLYYRMGQMNYTGTGTDKNYEKARMYYEKALELDNKDALYGLGKLYLNREYERYDMEKAVAYLTESANLGNEYAIRLLQYIKNIKSNSRWSVTVGVTRLFNHMSRILQERLQEEQKGRSMTDRKLKRKIDEKKQAMRTDLVSFLRSRGERLKRSGSEYEWKTGGEKVTVRGNIWYHQYEREGGDAIDFVRRFYNMDFPEAVSMLLAEQGIVVVPQEVIKKEKKEFILPKANQDMRRVYAYLLKNRFLDRNVVNHFAQAKMLYEDEEYHNAIFVGMDENDVPCHAHKRGTHSESGYKGNVDGSNPDYSFHYIGTGNRLYVFEAPIDMLSFISLHKENWKEHSYVALCSVASQAALHILKTNPQIEEVYTCLDHDKAGIEGNYRIAEAVREIGSGYILKRILPKFKDWNESLKSLNGIEPIPASEHPGLVRMKKLCADMVAECNGENIKNPLEELQQQYEKLKRLPQAQSSKIAEQSLEMSKVAFLFAKNKFASMEKHYEDEQYARTLYGMYPPHHDNCGYKSRMADIGERMQEINRTYRTDRIVTESEQIKAIGNIMSLSVDCLRLHMFAEMNIQKQGEGESICQALQP